MITAKEDKQIKAYLKSIGINTQEFFEEMHDHICTSFESRLNKSESLKDHITFVVQPEFGGVKGILKIKERQMKLRVKQMRNRFWQILKELLFGWPTILISLMVILADFMIYEKFGGETLLIVTLIFFGLVPILYFCTKQLQFYWRAKRDQKGYTSSEKFTAFSPFLLILVGVPNFVIQTSNILLEDKAKENFFLNTTIAIPLSILITLFFITSFKLFREEFTTKLTLK